MLRTSTGSSPVLPNQCGSFVSNDATYPGRGPGPGRRARIASVRQHEHPVLTVMIWIAVFPTLTVLNLALGDWLRTLTPVVRTFVLATIAVPIVIYALMPQLHRLRRYLLSRTASRQLLAGRGRARRHPLPLRLEPLPQGSRRPLALTRPTRTQPRPGSERGNGQLRCGSVPETPPRSVRQRRSRRISADIWWQRRLGAISGCSSEFLLTFASRILGSLGTTSAEVSTRLRNHC